MHEDQTSIFLDGDCEPNSDFIQLDGIIMDRGSRYSVTAGTVGSDVEIKAFVKKVKSNKRYVKATHNSYASRFVENGAVIDRKSDDGETGAGMVVLRQLHKANMVNVVVVVTRWFGGVKLYADRFKHVQDCTREAVEQLTKARI